MIDPNRDPYRQAVDAARSYLFFCQNPWPTDPTDTLRRLLSLITNLISKTAPLALPHFEEDQEAALPDPKLIEALKQKAGGLPLQQYYTVFNPTQTSEDASPTLGLLADDLLDIYTDLSEALDLWDKGHKDLANWTLVFTYQSHWGKHAVDAAQAMYVWLQE